ncbi:hypothetical protein MMC07_009094 [Pseudocyphellaria aurata]|nr:hypothetical protein [Pseudocyphellaria aurata]
MAQLDTLPPELLRNILSFLPFSDRHKLAMRRSDADEDDLRKSDQFSNLRPDIRTKRIIAQRTLRSLCLVSKLFQTLAEPLLYSSWKHYEETTHKTYVESFAWTKTQDICLQQFLRTLITRGDLSHHVKYIELENWRTPYHERGYKRYGETVPHAIDPEDSKMFVEAAKKACVPRDTKWLSAIAQGCADALVALLLTLVHNLEGLSFILPYHSRYPAQIIAHAAFDSVPPSLYSFPRLSHVSYAHCNIAQDGFNPSDLSPYFFFPAMRVIEGWQCAESGTVNSQKRWSLPQKKSKVISIELRKSQIDNDSIAIFLGACEALESFTLANHFFEEESLAYPEVCRSLQSVRSSLKQFRLDTQAGRFLTPFSAPSPSLNTFPKLECLNLELDFLLGPDPARAPQLADVLPTSITSLTLRCGEIHRNSRRSWDRKRLAPFVQNLAQCSKDKFPRLKKIELDRISGHEHFGWPIDPKKTFYIKRPDSIEYEDWYNFGGSSVDHACKDAGIDFSYRLS